MDVINILKSIAGVAEGYTRTALKLRTNIMFYREENYCKKCPLAYAKDGRYTGICNKDQGGCGCGVSAKTSQNHKFCPKGFWGNDWFKPEEFEEFIKENQ